MSQSHSHAHSIDIKVDQGTVLAGGDFSSAGTLEELVTKLHAAEATLETNLDKTAESTHLVSYLLTKVEAEQNKLNSAITQLEVSEVLLQIFLSTI